MKSDGDELVPHSQKHIHDSVSPQPTVSKSVSFSIQQSSWAAPFPDPGTLREYEIILPGSADKIFRLTEIEAERSHEIQRIQLNTQSVALNAQIKATSRGQWMALTLGFCAIGSGVYCASIGQAQYSIVLTIGVFCWLGITLITGRVPKAAAMSKEIDRNPSAS